LRKQQPRAEKPAEDDQKTVTLHGIPPSGTLYLRI
jgi:hypothetical protein